MHSKNKKEVASRKYDFGYMYTATVRSMIIYGAVIRAERTGLSTEVRYFSAALVDIYPLFIFELKKNI